MKEVPKKRIQDFWTRNVPGWDIFSKQYNPEQREFYEEVDKFRLKYEPYVAVLIDSFVEPGKRILEIGCGLGSDSRYMARRKADIVSLDLSLSNVSLTAKGLRLSGLQEKGVCADAEKLPFKDGSFDVVYSFGVLHHTPRTREALDEAYRVLRPGGKCAVMLYHKGYAYYYLLLIHGWKLLFGWLSKEKMMSRYDSTPLSKLYSKKEIAELFSRFQDLDIGITAYGAAQTHPILKFVYRLLHKSSFLMSRFGSYVIIKARKL